MRLFIIGEYRLASSFLRAATAFGHEIVGAAPSGYQPGHPALLAAASALGVPTFSFAPIAGGFVGEVRSSGAELLVLAACSQLVRPAALTCCPRGAIGFHPSLLPKYRGPRAVADAMKARETHTGVSVFWPDDGADTGPLLLQARCEITATDTAMSLYHDKLVPVGVHCLLTSIAMIAAGCAPRIPQAAG